MTLTQCSVSAVMLGNLRLTINEAIVRYRTLWQGIVPGHVTKLLRAVPPASVRTKNSNKLQERLRGVLEGLYDAEDASGELHEGQTAQAFMEYSTKMRANTGQCQT